MSETGHKHTNRLINETSPYLLQHAHNPVEWYPWGEEALNRAKAENKPILLSVGYSACHWCHVMERESFENETIAKMMNDNFINIKVDREERPDIDSIYMEAVQAMTGQGGWPMTVFLTPQGVPFFGGTYFPPVRRYGNMPSFPEILEGVSEAYRDRPEDIEHNATQMKKVLEAGSRFEIENNNESLNQEMLDRAWYVEGLNEKGQPARGGLSVVFDRREGGIGRAPKFPQPMTLEFTLRTYNSTKNETARQLLDLTLTKMAYGGIYDQLGGGFHRYSTDAVWLVPHFEKMLYDNSQLSLVYLQAYLATANELYRRIAIETLDYVAREMTSPEGGFYSTQDADSEGEEGKFFVWSEDEIVKALGAEDARLFNRYYGVSKGGNWEGHNILHVTGTPEEVAREMGVSVERLNDVLANGRAKLLALREKRIHPGRDEKILTSWNGLMLKSFAVASRVLNREDYRQIALNNASFILNTMRTPEGKLYRTYKDGKAHLNGFLEDYSYYADGLLALYEATFDLKWLVEARKLADSMLDKFWDDQDETFFDTASDHEELVTRPRSFFDNAVPSGNAVAADVLLRLALLTGEESYRQHAEGVLRKLAELASQSPTGFGRLLSALDFYLSSPKEVVIAGNEGEDGTRQFLALLYGLYQPNRVVMLLQDKVDPTGWPLLEYRQRIEGKPTAYVCENYACQQPVTDPAQLAAQLNLV
ncbi:MAG TPA: thioredoxin domain-containing protein [Chloroflexia bacterium]|nr:thioredoxin domain-containing protein [Chloroflexia bacterium]